MVDLVEAGELDLIKIKYNFQNTLWDDQSEAVEAFSEVEEF